VCRTIKTEMLETGGFTWREVVDKHHASLVTELSIRLESELNAAVSNAITGAIAEERSKAHEHVTLACKEARISQVESLNQVLRRLRSAGESEVLDLLARGAAANCAAHVVVLVFENNHARIAAHQGVAITPGDSAIDNGLKIEDIPAILNAVESKDPVVALATASEVSSDLARMLNASSSAIQKAYLFPILVRQSVMAMLVASGVQLSAPLELLCEAAGMRLESVTASDTRAPEPVPPQIPASETSGPRSWNDLSAEDQKLHLQAQRMARVRVAEMRLFNQNEIHTGTANSDIYRSLQGPIDKARDQFLQMFLSKSPTMVDYLHLEILRSLAHDDDRLLGNTYPGPMV
jgi:hypothetical protein